MKKFMVKWEVTSFNSNDEEIKRYVDLPEEAENLETLLDDLEEGKHEGYYTPEVHLDGIEEGDIIIEYVLIYEGSKPSYDHNEVWRDPDFKD
jgi:hypothetical protein